MTDPLKSADIHMIQRILPHRYPFLLVDKVVDIDGTRSARGIKNGDSIRVKSSVGEIVTKARVTDHVVPGVIAISYHVVRKDNCSHTGQCGASILHIRSQSSIRITPVAVGTEYRRKRRFGFAGAI